MLVWIIVTMIGGALVGLALHFVISSVIKVRPRDEGLDNKFKLK